MPRFSYFAREAAATLLRMAKTTRDPMIAAALVQRAADLKDGTEELPPVDVEAMAEEQREQISKTETACLTGSRFMQWAIASVAHHTGDQR